MNLYDLSSRYQQLLDQDVLDAEECRELEALHTDIEDECINRGKYIRNKQAELEAVTAARKEMQERERALTAKIDRNESWLAERMELTGFTKITKSPLFPLRVKRNPVSVDDYDKERIPENYFCVKIKEEKSLDKAAVKRDIEAGIEIPGVKLVQKLRIEFK